jgi:hypothetical protein
MSCNMTEISEHFRRTCYIHIHGGRISFSDVSAPFFHCRRLIFLSLESGACKFLQHEDSVVLAHGALCDSRNKSSLTPLWKPQYFFKMLTTIKQAVWLNIVVVINYQTVQLVLIRCMKRKEVC